MRHDYQIGVPVGGFWKEILNSDSTEYGGSGVGNFGGKHAYDGNVHGKPHGLSLTLPPLGMLVFKPEQRESTAAEKKEKAPKAKS